MKKILFICLSFCIILSNANAQIHDTTITASSHELHDMYMQKHKTNNTVAWVMLGSGIGMTVGGIAIGLGESLSSTKGSWLSYFRLQQFLLLMPALLFFCCFRLKQRKEYLQVLLLLLNKKAMILSCCSNFHLNQ